MWLFDLLKPAGPILGRVPPRIRRCAHERTRRLAVAEIDPLHGDDLIDDTRQLPACLAAFQLNLEFRAVEFVRNLFEDGDEHDALSACVLKLVQPADHLAAMQSVCAAGILLAGALAKGFRLLFGPTETQAAYGGDAVDKDHVVFVEVFERTTDAFVMRRAVAGRCRKTRVWSTDATRQITRGRPVVNPDGVDRQI